MHKAVEESIWSGVENLSLSSLEVSFFFQKSKIYLLNISVIAGATSWSLATLGLIKNTSCVIFVSPQIPQFVSLSVKSSVRWLLGRRKSALTPFCCRICRILQLSLIHKLPLLPFPFFPTWDATLKLSWLWSIKKNSYIWMSLLSMLPVP